MYKISLFVLLSCSIIFAKKTPFEAGVRAYETRDAGSHGMTAQIGPIDYAIKEFKKATAKTTVARCTAIHSIDCNRPHEDEESSPTIIQYTPSN